MKVGALLAALLFIGVARCARAAEITCLSPSNAAEVLATPVDLPAWRRSVERQITTKSFLDWVAVEQDFHRHREHLRSEPPAQQSCRVLLLSGRIIRGDAAKLQAAIMHKANRIDALYLVSPGGDLREAMLMGELVRTRLVDTEAAGYGLSIEHSFLTYWASPPVDICKGRDCHCASACFVVWAAGARRSGTAVGLHRPSFAPGFSRSLGAAEAQRTYRESILLLRDYLDRMEFPTRYFDRMMRTDSQSIVWLGQLLEEDKAPFDNDAEGMPTSIKEWIGGLCEKISPEERREYLKLGGSGLPSSPYHKFLQDRVRSIGLCESMALGVARAKLDR